MVDLLQAAIRQIPEIVDLSMFQHDGHTMSYVHLPYVCVDLPFTDLSKYILTPMIGSSINLTILEAVLKRNEATLFANHVDTSFKYADRKTRLFVDVYLCLYRTISFCILSVEETEIVWKSPSSSNFGKKEKYLVARVPDSPEHRRIISELKLAL